MTDWPARTTGTLTAPGVAFTVPWAHTALDQTGNRISVRSRTSRQPASMTSARVPRRRSEVANNSPNMPSVEALLNPTTNRSPASINSTATWIIQLSPGGARAVTALPATRAPG